MRSTHELSTIPDDELLRRLADLLRQCRRTEADLVAHIGEVDARRLYAREASPSMFAYCTERLHLSDAEGYLRIAAARASREHPVLLEMLADGRLHLTAIAKLAPHLTPENRDELLERATHRTKREIEELVAEIAPRPDAATVVRRLPEPRAATLAAPAPTLDSSAATQRVPPTSPGASRVASTDSGCSAEVPVPQPQLRPDAVAAHRPAVVEPLTPGRYRVQFTASAALRDKLERLRGLMRASVPDGDLAAIIERAVTEKLERLESRRFARTRASGKPLPARNTSSSGRVPSATARENAPAAARGPQIAEGAPAANLRPPAGGRCSAAVNRVSPAARDTLHGTRHIPAAIKRAVYERDGGRCRYVDEQGRRCTARDGLEYHHRHPFGFGGRHSVDGISLLCRVHNLYLAETDYGREAMTRHRRSKTASGGLGLGT